MHNYTCVSLYIYIYIYIYIFISESAHLLVFMQTTSLKLSKSYQYTCVYIIYSLDQNVYMLFVNL